MNFEGLDLMREPYVVGIAPAAIKPEIYEGICRKWPAEPDGWGVMGTGGDSGYNKLSLSERNNPHVYAAWINGSLTWRHLHQHIKSVAFIEATFTALQRQKVKIAGGWQGSFTARWELSSLPANGGYIKPHTDIASKVVTLVVPCGGFEWGMDVLRPRRDGLRDYQADYSDFDLVERLLPKPGGAIVFVKSAVSWHSVGPIEGPPGAWRRSLTINIERK